MPLQLTEQPAVRQVHLHAQHLQALTPVDGQHLVGLHKGHGAGEAEVVLKLTRLVFRFRFGSRRLALLSYNLRSVYSHACLCW